MSGRIVLFSVLRLAAIVVPLGVLLWLGFDWWWAAILATIIGVCISVLALSPMRESIARGLADRVDNPATDVDAEFEDASTE
ncbi:MAG TPA: DUF4229 domain-containing protein [Terrimesophilobacter sp.]|nr:DUF4229 domain-containing protein [Terrimesophilobacter sp.]HRP99749.1 DUF4229 domain-containing protein [Terrimesophilobacter sp.]